MDEIKEVSSMVMDCRQTQITERKSWSYIQDTLVSRSQISENIEVVDLTTDMDQPRVIYERLTYSINCLSSSHTTDIKLYLRYSPWLSYVSVP